MGKFSLKDFLGVSVGDLVDKVGDAIDKNVTSKEERLQAERDIIKILTQYELTVESGITQRLQIDMTSDSWLSKNIRPMSLVFVFGVLTLLSIFDGNFGYFEVNESYIEIYKALLSIMVPFYFGSRGAEKIFKIVKGQSGKNT